MAAFFWSCLSHIRHCKFRSVNYHLDKSKLSIVETLEREQIYEFTKWYMHMWYVVADTWYLTARHEFMNCDYGTRCLVVSPCSFARAGCSLVKSSLHACGNRMCNAKGNFKRSEMIAYPISSTARAHAPHGSIPCSVRPNSASTRSSTFCVHTDCSLS